MSGEQDQIRAVAERIARQLAKDAPEEDTAQPSEGANVASELAALRVELAKLHKKLAHIESHITHDETCAEERLGEPPWREGQRRADQPREGFSAAEKRVPLSSSTYIPAVGAAHAAHPSGERFGVGEAVSELVNFFEHEETCKMEPGGKPCDHCAMCSARGF